jgi:hypothetical protein
LELVYLKHRVWGVGVGNVLVKRSPGVHSSFRRALDKLCASGLLECQVRGPEPGTRKRPRRFYRSLPPSV